MTLLYAKHIYTFCCRKLHLCLNINRAEYYIINTCHLFFFLSRCSQPQTYIYCKGASKNFVPAVFHAAIQCCYTCEYNTCMFPFVNFCLSPKDLFLFVCFLNTLKPIWSQIMYCWFCLKLLFRQMLFESIGQCILQTPLLEVYLSLEILT